MRVGLMAPGFSPGDAVGNDLLGMYNALAARGDEPIIFTSDGEADFAWPVMHYADAPLLLDGADDVIIYHYCVADPPGLAILRRLSCRILIRYHNVTPASLMSRWSPEFGRTCKLGRTMLAELPDMAVDGFLADSACNAAELLDLGIEAARMHVIPPLHRCDELLGQPDDASTAGILKSSTYNVVAVGGVTPDMGFELMAESFGKAMALGSLDIHLRHVGRHDPRMQGYIHKIGEILAHYGVQHRFTFYGQVGAQSLATLYRQSDVFWTTSLHEGFCVPPVEAMAFGLPILSSRQAALSETCGDAAVYADGTDDFAVRLQGMLADDLARAALARKARARYEACFRPGPLRRRFLDVLDAALDLAARRVTAGSLDRSGDWFGLPRSNDLLDAALPLAPALPAYGLSGQDRRRDLVDWALREGPALSEALNAYARSPDLLAYAREIDVPRAAAHIGPALRLLWAFHRPARARFDLQGSESALAFWRWWQREGMALCPTLATSAQPSRNLTSEEPAL